VKYFIKKKVKRVFTVKGNCKINIKVNGDDHPDEQNIDLKCVSGILDTPQISKDRQLDVSSLHSMARDIIKGKKGDKNKFMAIYNFCSLDKIWHFGGPPDYQNIVKLIGSYGIGNCGVHQYLFHELCSASGLKARKIGIQNTKTGRGHAISEAFWDKKWHAMDSDGDVYFLNSDGEISSAEQVRKNPELVNQVSDEYGLIPIGYPINHIKHLFKADKVFFETDTVNHPATANFLLKKEDMLTLSLKHMEEIMDQSRLIAPFQMDGFIANTGQIKINFSEKDFIDNISCVKLPYVALSSELSENFIKSFKTISYSLDKITWTPVIGNKIKFSNPPLMYYVKCENKMKESKAGFFIQNHVQFNSLIVPFLKRGNNTLVFSNKGKLPFTGKLTFEWYERFLKKTDIKKAKSIKWSKEVRLCTMPNVQSRAVSLALDPRGNIWTAFQGKKDNQTSIYYGILNHKNSFEKISGNKTFYADFPDMYISPEGDKHLVYQSGLPWEKSDIFYVNLERPKTKIKVNTEAPWSTSHFPKLSGHKQTLAVAWQGPDTSLGNAPAQEGIISVWTKNLCTQKTLQINGVYKVACLPSITSDSRGNYHLVFVYQGVDYRLINKDLNSVKASQSIFPYPSDYGFGDDIACDSQDNIYTVWSARNYGLRRNIYFRKKTKSGWENCVRLSEGDFTDSSYPSMAVDSNGEIHVVWLDTRLGKSAVFYKRYNGEKWLPDLQISHAEKTALGAKVILKDKKPMIFWTYNVSGKNSIYYREEL
jgi:hypothetical protein